MERAFRKPADETYPKKIFAHQLITVDDLQLFKNAPGVTVVALVPSAALLVLQYVLSPMILQRKFGRHLTYLKQLVSEMQE